MPLVRVSNGGTSEPVLLASQTITGNTATTVDLSETLTNYNKVLITLNASYPMNGSASGARSATPIFTSVDDFIASPKYINWSAGAVGSGYYYYSTVTYVSPTSITIKPQTRQSGNTYYVYGIK